MMAKIIIENMGTGRIFVSAFDFFVFFIFYLAGSFLIVIFRKPPADKVIQKRLLPMVSPAAAEAPLTRGAGVVLEAVV